MSAGKPRLEESEVFDMICRILRWDCSRTTPATPIRAVDADGSMRASLALGLNEEYDLHLTIEHTKRWATVQDVIRSVRA